MSNTTTLAIGEDVPLALVDGQAPTALRLFKPGKNPSTKGEFLFDEKAAQKVMSAYRRMGRSWVMVDYDHGSLQRNPVDPSKSGKSAGRASLEVRDGELWATNIRWTPAAKESIEAREWPSISPAFEHDESGRPTWLINFGLTGNPALHAPAELIAANVLRAIWCEDEQETPEPARLASVNTGAEPEKTDATSATEALNTDMKKTCAELAAFLGIPEDDATEMMNWFGSKGKKDKEEMGKKAMASVVALSAGLPADAEEGVIVARLSALAAAETRVFAALGVKDTDAALGAISGLQRGAKDAEALSAVVAELKGKQLQGEVQALLNTAKGEKRITPAEADDASEHGLRATALSMGDKGPAWLGAHLKARPVIAALSTSYKQPEVNDKTVPGSSVEAPEWMGAKKYSELSAVEKERLADESPEAFARLSAEHKRSIKSANSAALNTR